MKIKTYNKSIELLSGEYVETNIDIPIGIISLVDCAIKGIESEVRAKILRAQFVSAYILPYRMEEIQIIFHTNGSFELLFNLDNFPLVISE